MPEIISRKEARRLGLKKFFSGKPCPRGHVCERYIRGNCIICTNERALLWAKQNPEQTLKRQREWQARNPEKLRKKTRDWRKAHPEYREKQRIANQIDRMKNPERYAAYANKYRAQNIIRMAERRRKMVAALKALVALGIEI